MLYLLPGASRPYIPEAFFERLTPAHRVGQHCAMTPPATGDAPDARQIWEGLSETDWQRITAAYWAQSPSWIMRSGLPRAPRDCQDENTIIVFTSDHGDMLGGTGLATKVGTPYEEVHNIPLIMRARNGRSEPCTCAASRPRQARAGEHRGSRPTLPISASTRAPGARQSIRPLSTARNLRSGTRRVRIHGQRFVYTQRIVWHGDWKYIFSPGGTDELYHLGDDPHERHNLAEDPAFREPLLAMAKRMWRKMRAIGDESLLKTEYATLRIAPVGPGD